jgi:hypothetical protein
LAHTGRMGRDQRELLRPGDRHRHHFRVNTFTARRHGDVELVPARQVSLLVSPDAGFPRPEGDRLPVGGFA